MTKYKTLLPIAGENLGFISTRNALMHGLKRPDLSYLVDSDQLERIAHGVYRLKDFPYTGNEQYMEAVMRTGRKAAAVSHESALALYGITDLISNKIHVSVPVAERIRRALPPLFSIHKENIVARDLTYYQGIPTVTAAKAIRQVLADKIRLDLLPDTIERAYRYDLISETERAELEKEANL